ncbi:hypothetical protein, partial [Corallococcus sicarius]|uniref:hypothetical protein n=1 Tax=Corallococcus sicarius TaxID=2316726 RepID=UPI001ABF481A
PESVLDMPGMPARHPRNGCSPCSGIAAHLGPESVLGLPRNTHAEGIIKEDALSDSHHAQERGENAPTPEIGLGISVEATKDVFLRKKLHLM